MPFPYNTHEMDESQNSVSPSAIPKKKLRNSPPKHPQEMTSFQERLIYGVHSLTKWHMEQVIQITFPKKTFILEDKAWRLGQSVTDLLKCDPKDWLRFKK